MPLSPEETKALTILVAQGVESGLREFRSEVSKRFDDVTTSIDGLSQKVEKVEQEQVSMGAQLGRVESRLERVEVDVKVIRDAVERHDDELDDLKKKRA
jgi:septal ring factor EnvC (AmiA/AmiB activator)